MRIPLKIKIFEYRIFVFTRHEERKGAEEDLFASEAWKWKHLECKEIIEDEIQI